MQQKCLWRREGFRAYLYMSPILVFFVAFYIMPLFKALSLSLQIWNYLKEGPAVFVGLRNYAELARDARFFLSLCNTAEFALLYTMPVIILGLALALLLNRPLRGLTFFRATFFAPVVTATVAVSLVWLFLFQPRFGLFNAILHAFHLPESMWLASPKTAMLSVALMTVWKSAGYNMILFLAGLQTIPEIYYDAARIDGAGRWHLLRHVTWPLLQHTTLLVAVLTIIGSFQVFTQIWIMTKGGPLDSTMSAVQYIYEVAFKYQARLAYASTVAITLTAIILVLTLIQLWLGRVRWSYG